MNLLNYFLDVLFSRHFGEIKKKKKKFKKGLAFPFTADYGFISRFNFPKHFLTEY